MKELFRESDLTKVSYYQALLEQAGIPTFLRNENLSTTEGLSVPEFYPALCIVNDSDYQSAAELIRAHLKQSGNGSPKDHVCGSCGETSPGNFDTCWNCQATIS